MSSEDDFVAEEQAFNDYDPVPPASQGRTQKKLECKGNDPLAVMTSPNLDHFNKESLQKYFSSWKAFCLEYKISIGKPPSFENYNQHFRKKFANGAAYSSLKSQYSHLSKCQAQVYGEKLEIWPELFS